MGQFGNQPDFATNDIQVVTPSNNIDSTTKLDAAVIYIGDNATVGNELKVIPAGVVGPSVVTGFSSLGYTGSNGTGYLTANGLDTIDRSGNGDGNLIVDIVAVNGAVTSITVNTPGAGYLNGDLIAVDDGGGNALFRVVAETGPPTADQAITFKGLGTGGFLPVTVDYVLATGTTVAELIAAK